MSKAAFLALLFALLGVSVHGGSLDKLTCSTNANAECGASAGLSISVRGPGRCYARSNSYCKALAKSTGNCLNYKTIYVGGKCRHIDVQEDVRCYAAALATAYTSAVSTVGCNSKWAHACTYTEAKAFAIACATARSILNIHLKLGHRNAACEASIDVAMRAVAKAVAKSSTKICVSGPDYRKVSDFDFAGAVQVALARAFATCWVYCDGKESHVIVDGGGEGVIVKDEKVVKTDDGGADAATGDEELDIDLGPDGVKVGGPGSITSGSSGNSQGSISNPSGGFGFGTPTGPKKGKAGPGGGGKGKGKGKKKAFKLHKRHGGRW